ncbi:hypothetical protein ADIARSV_0586 [Arcticibacter svalbardensis MN12-7]|uniref:Uncharacterized protein n=1 Tax=Arcticibacter svalbardensis MN12-7 TaxID=1150600 RepID=R9GWS0_9SPHI|nr:PQQ-binding-like beta-propeller repeat protein [Arcticibacter svalbardensis]EOR96181.1 hypothetical protein ADIARSV_0586 [Arcticibacter svalbardensis MN12-7]
MILYIKKNRLYIFILCVFFISLRNANANSKLGLLTFAVVTDTHIGKPGNTEGLIKIINDINQRSEINFVVLTGDITDFGLMPQLLEAKRILDKLNKPYYIIPGNHDTAWSGNGGLSFIKIFGSDKFLVDYKGYQLIGINTGPYIRHAGGFVTDKQLKWLDSVVNVIPKNKPVLMFSHMPFLEDNVNNCSLVLERLDQMNTLVTFCGHGHSNKIFDYGGLYGIMTVTAQKRNGITGYNIYRLNSDSLEVKLIDPDSQKDSVWKNLEVSGNRHFAFHKTPIPLDTLEFNKKNPLWTFHSTGNIASTPAILKDCFFVGDLNGEFKSHNLKDGKVNWSFKTTQAIYSSPVSFENSIIFGSADSNIYCLNAKNGKLIWKMKVGDAVVASPIVKDNKLYIGASDLHYRCIDPKKGTLLWKSPQLAGFPPGKPSIENGKILFGTWNRVLYALNIKNGQIAWEWLNESKNHYYSPAISTPAISKNRVYVVAPDEMIHILDLATGKLISKIEGHRVRESIGVDKTNNLLIAKTMKDSVIVWDIKDDKPKIFFKINAKFNVDYTFSDVSVHNNIATFGTTFGRVYGIDLTNKKIKWQSKISNGMVNSPISLPNDRLLVTAVDGGIFLYGIKPN